MYYVYAIYNKKHKKIYIGQTKDLDLRIKLYNTHEFKSCYTNRFDGIWELFYKEEHDSRNKVLIREKQLKSYRGREYLKNLISPVAQR